MKVELLSPVGNKKTLYQAIHNGADAVYLAGKDYGARKYADNFTKEELKEVVRYAHLFNVKVYITVNTIIYENEINDFLEYVFYLYKINVDALIMQDVGMIKAVKDKFPNMDVHASTQCHNHNDEGLNFLKSLGVSRVVLDREMSLNEINNLKSDIEKEVFVHGALCYSYSGCCLFSSLNGGRSGNRGECTQCCRLPYELYQEDKKIDTDGNYLLSTKDLNTTGRLKDILDSNIVSLKIEGRMKSPEYVGYVTRIYRKLIDNYYNNKEMTITKEEEDNLKLLFNRDFTNGYLFEDNIMNITSPNHIGLEIGKVIKITNDKIYIKLDKDLNQEDGIRFKNSNLGMIVNRLYNEDKLLVNSIKKGNIAILDNKLNIKKDDIVLKTIDKKLTDSINQINERKIDISYLVEVDNNKLTITITDSDNIQVKSVTEVESAKNMPTSSDNIKTSLSKVGDSIYNIVSFNIKYNQDIFIPISNLNDIRRNIIDELNEKRINRYNKSIVLKPTSNKVKLKKKDNKNRISILVRNEEQLNICIDNNIDMIYTDSKKLYNKYKEIANVYYKTPRVINKFYSIKNGNILCSELGSINKYYKDNKINIDYTLNTVNSKTLELFNNYNVDTICLSVEIDYNRIKDIMNNAYNVELLVYGKVELMITKDKLIKDNNKYYLVNKNKRYRILNNNNITSIMDYKNIDLIDKIDEYLKLNIHTYRIDLLDEEKEEIERIIDRVKSKLN